MRTVLNQKLSGEAKNYMFDFSADLAVGETISGSSCSASIYSGATGTAALTIGSASVSGGVVTQAFSGGTAGAIYSVLVSVTTSAGQTLNRSGFLAIWPDPV